MDLPGRRPQRCNDEGEEHRLDKEPKKADVLAAIACQDFAQDERPNYPALEDSLTV